jgi:hypothetical protein
MKVWAKAGKGTIKIKGQGSSYLQEAEGRKQLAM